MSIVASILFLLGFGIYAIYKYGQEELNGGRVGGIKLVIGTIGLFGAAVLFGTIAQAPGMELVVMAPLIPLLIWFVYSCFEEIIKNYRAKEKEKEIQKIASLESRPTDEEIVEYIRKGGWSSFCNEKTIFSPRNSQALNTVIWCIKMDRARSKYDESHPSAG